MNDIKIPPREGALLPASLVTGASSGLGFEIARQLAAAGTSVVALGRDGARLDALNRAAPDIATVQADLTDLSGIDKLAARIRAEYPDLSILINNAGIQFNERFDAPPCDAAKIREEIDTNLSAPLLLTRALLAHLAIRPEAMIVNVCSGLAYLPRREAAVYSATKAGLRLFGDAMRVQLEGTRIRVVEVVLPLVDTPMTQGRGKAKLSAARAAADLIAGLHARRERILIGQARMLPVMLRLAPGLLARMMRRAD